LRKRINDLLDAVDEDEIHDKDGKPETEEKLEKLEPVEDVDVDKILQDAMESEKKQQEAAKETAKKPRKSKAAAEQEVN